MKHGALWCTDII